MEGGVKVSAISLFERTVRENRPINPFGSDFYRDLLAAYGQEVESRAYDIVDFSPFEPLICQALDRIRNQRPELMEGVDLLILAHYLPNAIAYNSTTSYLLDKQKWEAFAFAVSDQQTGSALSAVRFAKTYLETGEYQKAAVIAVDQTALPRASTLVQKREIIDAAAVIILEAQGANSIRLLTTESQPLRSPIGEAAREQIQRLSVKFGIETQSLRVAADAEYAAELSQSGISVQPISPRRLATGSFWALGDWSRALGSTPGYLLSLDFSLHRVRSTLYGKNGEAFGGLLP